MLSRREFLRTSSLIALAPSVPAFLAQTARATEPDRDHRVLVVIQLDGGNDGIDTVVPFADEGYARNRKQLHLPSDRIHKVNDQIGLHPAMRDALQLLESDRLAIVQGVGYPNPNRSHDVSMAIWQTCRFDREEHKGLGWIGRALDSRPHQDSDCAAALLVGREPPPVAIRGRRSVASVLSDLNDYVLAQPAVTAGAGPGGDHSDDITAFVRRSTLDAYTTADRLKEISRKKDTGAHYPETELARRLGLIAQLIKADFGTRVYYVVQSGYDTHYVQAQTHGSLLAELSGGLRSFLDDLAASGIADRVLVLAFSEFGRRVEENGSLGTDHGTAGPVFLAGSRVKAGLVGSAPSLTDLQEGDLKWAVDFRQIYATVLEEWLSINAADCVGKEFKHLPLLRTS